MAEPLKEPPDLPEEHEGAFDEQLTLPLPSVAPPQPFTCVIKRDGRTEDFDKRKIGEAIFKAAQSIGGQDRDLAQSLASAVSIYLTKRNPGGAPHVDQVHDAVERVLIHMSHARTALAYARYRDRRARIRRLREGDMKLLLSELEEARTEREALAGHGENALFVQTSADTLVTWDRARIVEALTRETALEESIATVIAIEVEQQIVRAQMKTLTASLIRELVGARLVEHSLDEFRERHRRLGVPVFDAHRIIRGVAPETVGLDPAGTDRVLAQAVKKEYALAEVFSSHVGEAHLRGDIHLHYAGLIDRFHSAAISLEYIARYGVEFPGIASLSAPPQYPETLLAQMMKYGQIAQVLFAADVEWSAVNLHFAPFLVGLDEKQVAQLAQMLIYEHAYRAIASEPNGPGVALEVVWNVSRAIAGQSAIGAGGKVLDRKYRDFQHHAQQCAWALFDVVKEGAPGGAAFDAPELRFTIDNDFFRSGGCDRFLIHVCDAAALARPILFRFARNAATDAPAPWQVRGAALHAVTLNLPRAAYRAARPADLPGELTALLELAAAAHQEKARFLEGLLYRGGASPLALLSLQRDGKPLLGFDDAECLVALEGLNEAVEFLIGAQLHQGEEPMALADQVLDHLAAECARLSEKMGLRMVLCANQDADVSRRLATLDIKERPRTAGAVVKPDADQSLAYTTGVRLSPAHALSPVELARREGHLHTRLAQGALTEIALPREELLGTTLADTVRKIYHHTGSRAIRFVAQRESRT